MVSALLVFAASRQVLAPQAVPDAWSTVAPTVAVVSSAGQPTGLAVAVSADGVLLAHRASVPGPGPFVVTLSGPASCRASVVAEDEVTGLVGLQAAGWPSGRPYAPVATADPTPKELLLAATLSGPLQGQTAQNQAAGRMETTSRFLPLTEIRFEQSAERVAGAVLFNQSGQLVGVLGATLATPMAPAAESFAAADVQRARPLLQNYGPQGLTTGYVVSTPVLARTVKGFVSPSRRVSHPTLGVSFREDSGQIRLTEVRPGTTAEAAGLRVGDLVKTVDGRGVTTSLELAAVLFQLRVGQTVMVGVLRDGVATMLPVVVAGS